MSLFYIEFEQFLISSDIRLITTTIAKDVSPSSGKMFNIYSNKLKDSKTTLFFDSPNKYRDMCRWDPTKNRKYQKPKILKIN